MQSRAGTHIECFSSVKPQSFCTQQYRFCDNYQGNTTGTNTTGFSLSILSTHFYSGHFCNCNSPRTQCNYIASGTAKLLSQGFLMNTMDYISFQPNLTTIDGVIQRFCLTELLSVPRQIQHLSCAFSFHLIRIYRVHLVYQFIKYVLLEFSLVEALLLHQEKCYRELRKEYI